MTAEPREHFGQLQLLGQFVLESEGERLGLDAFGRRRPAELLKLLGSAPGCQMRRDVVIEHLWPDKAARSGVNNLHRAIYDLRRIAGESIVRVEHGVLSLPQSLTVDVREFEEGTASADASQLGQGLSFYGGPLCTEDCSIEWLDVRGTELRLRFEDASLRVARHLVTVGDETGAISALRRLLSFAPTLEDGHRLLMRALSSSGRPRDALSQYARCTEILAQQLDSKPGAETMRLRDEIEAGLAQQTKSEVAPWRRLLRRLAGSSDPPTMHGRQSELGTVRQLVDAVAGEGHAEPVGAVLFITGEAGGGKTRLVSEVVRLAGERGAFLLAGSASDMGIRLPFAPFAEAWAEYRKVADRPSEADPFASFTPESGQPQADMLRLFLAVERALTRAASDRPAVLIIEDLHWADDSSVQLFQHLVRVCRSIPLLLVGTCRQEELVSGSPLHGLVTGLSRERHGQRLSLGPLSLEATARQVEDILRDRSSTELSGNIFALTGGNAFFTEELAMAHAERGHGATLDEADTVVLAEVVRERAARLGDDAERFVRAASIVGRSFSFRCAQAVCGLADEAAMAALEASLDAWLVEEAGDDYRFRHALVQSEIYGGLSRERKLAGHGTAADFLLAEVAGKPTPALGAALAHHLREAKRFREAMPHLIAAGHDAMERVGFPEARRHFDSALAVMDQSGIGNVPERFGCLKQLGVVHCALSNMGEGIAHLERARSMEVSAPNWDASAAATELDAMIAEAMITVGDLKGAEAQLDRALTQLDPDGAPAARLLRSQGRLRWCQERHEDTRAIAEHLVESAQRRDDPEATADGYELMAMACHSLGDWQQGVDSLQRRRDLVGDSVDVSQTFEVHL